MINPAGILDAVGPRNGAARRDLLACLFDELHVRDRVIVGYKPRSDRAAEVTALMERVSRSSPGGVRGYVQLTQPTVPVLRFG